MDAKIQAEKIHALTCDCSNPESEHRKFVIEKIATQIEEAQAEAYKAGCDEAVLKFRDDKQKVWNAATEKAAGIVLEVGSSIETIQGLLNVIAERIRKMQV